jgi:glyoxylase-like metal-dependent hydrolase (beta-lactamase superfamily II)
VLAKETFTMWIGEPGKVTDRIDFLGIREICLYLLKGKEAMIIGGGMSHIAPSLEKQFPQMDFDTENIKYLVVTHSHLDHCGAVPYLKRKFPQVQILASAYSKEVFSKEKVVNAIASANKGAIDASGLQNEHERLNLGFDGIHVDRVVAENDIIDLGDGIKAHFIETPGHTKCSLAVYVPELKAMFPSDAAPVPLADGSGLTIPSPQYDFLLYVESLKKLCSYEIEICAFEHNGVLFGEQARNILPQGLEQTEKFKNYVVEQYQEIGNMDKVSQKLASEIQEKNELPFLTPDLQVTITKAAVRKILAT